MILRALVIALLVISIGSGLSLLWMSQVATIAPALAAQNWLLIFQVGAAFAVSTATLAGIGSYKLVSVFN